MASKKLLRNELVAQLAGPLPATKKRALENLLEFMTPYPRDLSADEMRVNLSSVDELDPKRIVHTSGVDGLKYGIPGSRVVDKSVRIIDVSGSTLSPLGGVIVDGNIITYDWGFGNEDWLRNGYYMPIRKGLGLYGYEPETGTCIASTPNLLELTDPRGYFYFNWVAVAHNFGHFVFDLLLRAKSYHHACELAGSQLVPILPIQAGAKRFVYPIMDILFREIIYDKDDVVFLSGRAARPACCFASTTSFHGPKMALHRASIDYIKDWQKRTNIFETAGDGRGPCVWINRDDAVIDRSKQYMITNDAIGVVDGIAAACGFNSLTLSKFTPAELLGLFKEVRVLAGMHGAGLFNSILCPNLELMIECCYAPYTYEAAWVVAEGLGVRVERVPAIPSLVSGGCTVDLEHFVRALRGGFSLARQSLSADY